MATNKRERLSAGELQRLLRAARITADRSLERDSYILKFEFSKMNLLDLHVDDVKIILESMLYHLGMEETVHREDPRKEEYKPGWEDPRKEKKYKQQWEDADNDRKRQEQANEFWRQYSQQYGSGAYQQQGDPFRNFYQGNWNEDPFTRRQREQSQHNSWDRTRGQSQQRQTPGAEPWYTVLGLSVNATIDQIRKAYRRLASKHHPDKGGDVTQMQKINKARDEAFKAKGVSA